MLYFSRHFQILTVGVIIKTVVYYIPRKELKSVYGSRVMVTWL